LEGVSFVPRASGDSKSRKVVKKNDPDFVDIESKEAMTLRMDAFFDGHLFPLLGQSGTDSVVAIVSHGITLSVLWRRLLQRLPSKSVALHQELRASHGHLDIERLGGWSNTGYLEIELLRKEPPQAGPRVVSKQTPETEVLYVDTLATVVEASPDENTISTGIRAFHEPNPTSTTMILTGWTTTIHAVNSKIHLAGLKRTGGGVGSSRHDDNQKSIDSFFKRKKMD
jgi:hypothetical protein